MSYRIIRFRKIGDNEIIKRGLTLEEAQAHCKDPATRLDQVYFDGYMVEEDYTDEQLEDLDNETVEEDV